MALTYNDLITGDASNEKIKRELDRVFTDTGVGPLSSAITDTITGINHRQEPNPVPINKDYYGLTFFTRPRMNMRTLNLRHAREFTHLLSSNPVSIPRAIRAMLDTESYKYDHGSPLVDEFQAFIPILSNQLISMGGWPDLEAPSFTSKPGAYREEFGHVDGIVRNYSAYDITANFRNLTGDPITTLFLVWLHYMSLVFTGTLIPHMDSIIENEIDYNTRIYRLILDPSKRFVQKIACCGAAYPLNCPIGNAMNYEQDTPINRGNDQISIRFRCFGAMYNDPITVTEFNQTVIQQYSDMDDRFREQKFIKINDATSRLFNHRCYPRIDPDTWELQWWVPRELYELVVGNEDAIADQEFNEDAIF